MTDRYDPSALRGFATALLRSSGMSVEKAEAVAGTLLEGDLLGHSTHGLQMLPPYLKSIAAGEMTLEGEPKVVRDRGSAVTWDGLCLPGPWLVTKAIDLALGRAAEHGVVTVVIQRSHHIACLEAYLKQVTDRGCVLLLMCSDPSVATVAPHGGLEALYTPNPIAMGIPTQGDPILIDISASTTTNGLCMRLTKQKGRLPYPWVKTAEGEPSDDPAVLFQDPPGTLLPLGGMELGHKGFALGILIEALTSALGGYGRAEAPNAWGASVFLQVIDPSAFGGIEAFQRETTWFVDACHRNPTRPGDPPVRLPGEAALRRREDQLANGVVLYPGILDSLESWAKKWGVALPARLE